jgi:carboxylate-amine ligase
MLKKEFMPKKYSIFSVYGIEAEYMIVNKNDLKVSAIADQVLKELNNGEYCNEVELKEVAWSNELVNHVLEIKSLEPTNDLQKLEKDFSLNIQKINTLLALHDCVMMPTAMHPWFDPSKETKLWPHDQREIYNLYNEIFDCKGHGWSNLQSVHINLPYSNEEEFRKLHSSIRAVIPLIPAFAASSPYFDGMPGEYACNRLAFYEKNQAKIPSIIGNIIPEKIESTLAYREILKGIYQDISIYDNAKTLQNPWLNSRAAIPKFDVGAVEIRLMDIQESPFMDFTLIHFFTKLIEEVATHKSLEQIENLSDKLLRNIYDQSKKYLPEINDQAYFELFDLGQSKDFKSFKFDLISKMKSQIPERYVEGLNTLQLKGNLSERLTKEGPLVEKYKKLIECLGSNTIYA